MRFLAVQDRESGRWALLWSLKGYYESVPGSRRKKRFIQYRDEHPFPEKVSPFIKAHTIIEAESKEEAQCQVDHLNST